jgi:hypothetical protein
VQRIGDGHTGRVLDDQTMGDQVMLCAVYTVHVETRSTGFLVEPQNQGRRFVSGLASKPLGRFVCGLASKPLGWFSSVWAQNRW